ncbi:hypothetical protein [Acetobacterium woodii]|uniref:Uncharacterized protein n=1 Tax=Acetobacterium woodii (strain ATCC 29683 / DSM 1030 / JCM 2381 / KCTC 1655 / WB1) TaxID=931626 RepID=H6LEV2_ACEWD|nr:hypothetical protein [Acetobacterium woodii]AFA49395.1 hypothetical protein Awo_c26390 [Acetobacterium woodii DSM 1030]
MNEDIRLEREKRRMRRKRKKQRSTIITIMLLFILASVGVVGAQTQGYEVFYHGESLGFVQNTGVFKSAVERIEKNLAVCYNRDNIHLGDGFQLIPARVEETMDSDMCIQVLNSKGIELYVDGASIMMDGENIGTLTSMDEAQRLIKAYQDINVDSNNHNFKYVDVMVPLAETKDFSAMLAILKAHSVGITK